MTTTLFPILNTIIINTSHSILPKNYNAHLRNFIYGLTTGMFFLFWFFGATYISKFSDTFGRRKSLLICIIGLFLGYGLTALAIFIKNIYLLFLSRIIAGLTAGSQPVAQAAIIDISSDQTKTNNLSLIMFSFSLGLISGPLIAAFFSNSEIFKYFNLTTPFIIIMILCLVAYTLIFLSYKDLKNYPSKFDLNYRDLYKQFYIVFRTKKLLKLSTAFFFMQFAFNTFYIFIATYFYRKYGFSTSDNEFNFLIMGIAMAFSNLLLVPKFNKINNKGSVIHKCLVTMVISLIPIYFDSQILSVTSCSLFVIFFAVAYTNMLSLFSDYVNKDQQGWIMGITVSIFTLASFLTSILTQELFNVSIHSPIDITIIGCVLAYFGISNLFSYNKQLQQP